MDDIRLEWLNPDTQACNDGHGIPIGKGAPLGNLAKQSDGSVHLHLEVRPGINCDNTDGYNEGNKDDDHPELEYRNPQSYIFQN